MGNVEYIVRSFTLTFEVMLSSEVTFTTADVTKEFGLMLASKDAGPEGVRRRDSLLQLFTERLPKQGSLHSTASYSQHLRPHCAHILQRS